MMNRILVVLAFSLMALSAHAGIFKCKGSDGKLQFSDTPCRVGSVSEVVPDRAPITQQQRQDAQQRALQMQGEAAALDEDKSLAQANQRAAQQRQEPAAEKPAAVAPAATSQADAYANCVRDVERRGASQTLKAELIAACRTAGSTQATSGMSADSVSECVRNVERTGASEAEKARQLAICHGGDVKPRVVPVRPPRNGLTRYE